MTTEIRYTATVDGAQREATFTPEDVSDERAGWNPDVALAYARHLAVDAWGRDFDVNTVDVTLREDRSQYDETGGVSL